MRADSCRPPTAISHPQQNLSRTPAHERCLVLVCNRRPHPPPQRSGDRGVTPGWVPVKDREQRPTFNFQLSTLNSKKYLPYNLRYPNALPPDVVYSQ